MGKICDALRKIICDIEILRQKEKLHEFEAMITKKLSFRI
jgi:hypothetical protein